ncbi:MAG TPA: hypothetical protein VLT45_16785 [Kofleriaceae bacterium]|nr:hypothetical protein [Kofleriaceae bacterium]
MRRVLVLVLVGCGGSHGAKQPDAAPPDVAIDAEVVPVFRNPVTLPDDQLASQALAILGATGTAQECNACHGLTRQHIRYWRALTDTSMSTCLTDLAVSSPQSAQQMIDCLRTMPAIAGSDFAPQKLGVAAAAARLPWFQYTFHKAYGDQGDAQLADFVGQAGMPQNTVPSLTQDQFDIVAEYFARGVPLLDAMLPQDGRPSECTPGISSDVAAHTAQLATTGWRAVNRDNMMAMFDCGAATDPKQCLADKTDTTWGVHGTLRLLKDVTYQSSYWTRSSPDGRFVAHGVANVSGSYVLDLQRDATIPIATQYDPGFFPDNAGFVFQGGNRNVCAMSVLTSNPASITMNEAGCSDLNQIGLYQHVGRALGGGDYFAIDSEFVSDDGGHSLTNTQPAASFGPRAYADFTPMVFDGTQYNAHTQVTISQPYEGDSVLSPSATLELTRVSDVNDNQIGYVLRKVIATPSGSTYTIQTPEIARYCTAGGKPAFSFDERWIVYHHYVTDADAKDLGFTGPSDPGFADYRTKGAANLYLMDLATGTPVRITNMPAGQYALFPHFRSDGWIYADIRDTNANHEYIVASDAALLAE